MNIRVLCINDSNRPNDLPVSRWVKKGEKYTVIEINKMNAQGGTLGCKLAEINNDDQFPWTHFALTRFVPIEPLKEEGQPEEDYKVKEAELPV